MAIAGAMALVLIGGIPTVGGAPPAMAVPSAKTVDGSAADWAGVAPTVAGTSAVSSSEFVYQDHLFDDTGRNDYSKVSTSYTGDYRGLTYRFGPPGGHVTYPINGTGCAWNCADLHQLRVAAVGDKVYFLVRLNTLLRSDSTVVGIALGDATSSSTTPLTWPFGANVRTQGSSNVLTLWGTGGALGTTPLSVVGGSVAVSTTNNVIEASLPRSLVPEQLRMHVGTGLWDATLNRWMPLSPTTTQLMPGGGSATDPAVFDAAFSANDFGHWFDHLQSRTITTADLTPLVAQFGLTSADVAAPQPGPGYHERIFESEATIDTGEGVSRDGIRGRGTVSPYTFGEFPTRFHFLGKSQPYAVYVPAAGYNRMTLLLHGGGFTHGTMSLHDHMEEMAEHGQTLLVSPLGRGVANTTTDYGELDVLEVYDDASAHYPTADRNRTTLWGYSMGGLGVQRMIVTKPDLFAASVAWAAPHASDRDMASTDGGQPNGFAVDHLDNALNQPWHGRHCTSDTWAPYSLALAAPRRLHELGYEYYFRSLDGCDHVLAESGTISEPLPPTAADFTDDADVVSGATITTNPRRVVFKMSEAWWRPDISSRLVFDKAYWVSGVQVRDTSAGFGSIGSVDAVTHGFGGNEPATVVAPNSTGMMGPYSYVEMARTPTTGPAIPVGNRFRATVTNLEAVAFDLARMGLVTSSALTAELTSDGATTVRLKGAGGKTARDSTGALWPGATTSGTDLLVPVAAGGSVVVVS